MRTVKKSLSLLLALMLVLALGATAFAAGDTYTITIENTATEHTYEAYQIFAGDLTTDGGQKILSNIVWGSGITEAGKTALGSAANKAESITNSEQAAAFAKEVAPYLNTHTDSGAQANGKYTIMGLPAGYYLVKDKDNTLNNKDDFYTAYIMKVVDNVTAQPKGDKPTLTKQIKHNDEDTWGVVGDNQIGDTVEFRTITTVPNTSNYTTYDYIIHDTMSVGLTSNVKTAADVTVKVNDTTVLDAAYYTVTENGNGFDLKIDVLKAIADSKMAVGGKLYIYYSGVLNENARIYDGNPSNQTNEAYLEYSNNPNGTDKGKTETSKVYDWTFKLQVKKENNNNTSLTGAKFVLSETGTLKVADMQCDDNGVPAVTDNLIALVKEADGTYHIATDEEKASNTVTKVYHIDAGSPIIKGLDDATFYYLYETKAPAGYNLLADPVKFSISANYSTDGSELAAGSPTVTVGTAAPSETLSIRVENEEGSVLPSTGGMGTTLFYILGGLLVVGAGVVLVTKKRMSKTED